MSHARVREGFAEALPIGAVGDAFAGGGDVVLVVSDLDVGEQRTSLADEEEPAPHDVTSGSHVDRIGIGDGHQASPNENRSLLGVDAVALGLGAVDGLHVEGVSEDEGDAFPGAEVGEPVPTVDALDGHDQVLAKRGDGEEEADRVAGEASVQKHHPVLPDNADVHRPRMQIDPAVVLVWPLVEVHSASSLQPRRVYSAPSARSAIKGPA